MASLFSLLQAPVVYSCVAGVEGGRGLEGREKGRGVGKRVPFPFCNFLPLPFLSLLRRLQLFKRQDLLSYPIDSRTRTRFHLKVLFAYSEKKKKKMGAWKLVFNCISPAGLSRLFLLKELKRSLDRKLSDRTSNIQ